MVETPNLEKLLQFQATHSSRKSNTIMDIKLQPLVEIIAKPFDLPAISGISKMLTDKKAPTLPMFGKRNKFKFTVERTSTSKPKTSTSKELKSDENNEVKENKKRKEEEENDKSKEEPKQSETDKPIEIKIEITIIITET